MRRTDEELIDEFMETNVNLVLSMVFNRPTTLREAAILAQTRDEIIKRMKGGNVE